MTEDSQRPEDDATSEPRVVASEPTPVVGTARRLLHVVWALGLAVLVVVPNLPRDLVGSAPSTLAGLMRPVSFAQSWRMYAPNPQRGHSYMNLTAHYPDGRSVELPETEQEQNGWTVTWAGKKTRVDIWRHYANFNPKKANEHRKWYLRAVCIREARKGEIPTKIVMEQVRRGFTSPKRVAKGKRDLGRLRRRTIAWMPCKTRAMLALIEADRQRRGQPVAGEAS